MGLRGEARIPAYGRAGRSGTYPTWFRGPVRPPLSLVTQGTGDKIAGATEEGGSRICDSDRVPEQGVRAENARGSGAGARNEIGQAS
jgi:hypothetical protein